MTLQDTQFRAACEARFASAHDAGSIYPAPPDLALRQWRAQAGCVLPGTSGNGHAVHRARLGACLVDWGKLTPHGLRNVLVSYTATRHITANPEAVDVLWAYAEGELWWGWHGASGKGNGGCGGPHPTHPRGVLLAPNAAPDGPPGWLYAKLVSEGDRTGARLAWLACELRSKATWGGHARCLISAAEFVSGGWGYGTCMQHAGEHAPTVVTVLEKALAAHFQSWRGSRLSRELKTALKNY